MSTTFAAIVSTARRYAGLTAPEFDYQLTLGSELGSDAYNGLGAAIYHLANEGYPEVGEGDGPEVLAAWQERADALRERYATEIARMISDAKTKSYSGWSTASSGPIRYAR